jgi:protein-S-isoprenylcysteine O-methyltransferase Ste14
VTESPRNALYCIDPDLMGWAALPSEITAHGLVLPSWPPSSVLRVLRAWPNFTQSRIKRADFGVGGPYRLVRHPMNTAFVALG